MHAVTTFVLVHGAGHGGWCWEPLGRELGARGHEVLAPDLPCDDVDAGLDAYAEAVLAAGRMDGAVVVGHSLGALTAAVVANRAPVASLVLVAGIVGVPGQALADLADVDADRDGPLAPEDYTSFPDGTFEFTEAGARRVLYHDCDEAVTADAISRLRRQRSMWSEPLPIAAWPDVPVASVVCRDDRVVNPAWAERIARDRLGVEPVLLGGGHSPMLARPDALADVLLETVTG